MPTVGTCSLCNGAVMIPDMWGGIIPPVPTCPRCGSTAQAPHGKIIPMEKPANNDFKFVQGDKVIYGG